MYCGWIFLFSTWFLNVDFFDGFGIDGTSLMDCNNGILTQTFLSSVMMSNSDCTIGFSMSNLLGKGGVWGT
jgi:hypothetical protein